MAESCGKFPHEHSIERALSRQPPGVNEGGRIQPADSRRAEGRESIEDESRNGRPSVSKTTENVVRVRDLAYLDRRLAVRMIGEELNLNHTTVHQILTNELKMRKICAKMVPKTLSQLTVSWPGHNFGTLENIQMAVTDQLKAIPISEFHQFYEEWKKRLQYCVALESSNFEGDNVEL
ncbi:HTH_48 domain-containing protein [Trichonephila clavipes]|uniref:HTH_48 domain-containing protein n=1 Tax=Trichonephila clavipes TaxID=2585209 RepID=A0A8X6W1A2_TRICX|nr:HTH_48 domain-containing protein [Trichonephila clavipes]